MGLCLRPVIETWGDSLDYSSSMDREDVVELIDTIASLADQYVANNKLAHNDYIDMEVVWVADGAVFLDRLAALDVLAVQHAYTENHDRELTDGERSLFRNLQAGVDGLRKSLDPQDGSLRLYVD